MYILIFPRILIILLREILVENNYLSSFEEIEDRSKKKLLPEFVLEFPLFLQFSLKVKIVIREREREKREFYIPFRNRTGNSVRSSNPHENVISRRGIWLERKRRRRRRRPGKMTDDTGVVTAYKMPTCREATASPRYRFTISIKYRCCPLPVCRTEVIIQMFPMRNVDLRRCSASPSGMKDDRSRAVPRHHGV